MDAARFIAQSYGGWPTERSGDRVKTKQAPLAGNVPSSMNKSFEAVQHVETTVPAAPFTDGLVLRYGAFLRSWTAYSKDGFITELVRKRNFPVLVDGKCISSFIHIDDAAEATYQAVLHGSKGIYNIVDDGPVAMATWLLPCYIPTELRNWTPGLR